MGMGVVHYRYRSGVQTFSVPVPGAFASVSELKRLIAATARHGSGGGRTRARGGTRDRGDGIALCDPRTGEEYVDQNTMIPQNSTVLVHRIAGRLTDSIQIDGTPADTITASSIILENDGMAFNKPVTESVQKSSAFAVAGTDDEVITAITTVIDAADIKWGRPLSGGGYDGGQLGHACGRPMEEEAPPPGYVCRVCCVPGHFVWQCPTGNKPPPPGYICYKCGVPGHFIHSCPNYGNRKYDSRRTSSLIPIVSSFDNCIPAEMVQDSAGDSLPAELHCPLCKKVMTDAMLSSKCCYASFCDKCIRDYVINQSKCLCGVEILADDLIPNQTLRITISSLLSSRTGGLSGGTVNLASSNSSNLDGKSLTASAVLKGDNKQHMDSALSATTEGSCLITACKNPVEKLTHSDLQSKTEVTGKTSVKTKAAAGFTETIAEPRCQKQPQPDGVAIVSGKLELKVVRTKSEKKQKKGGTTGNGNMNCAEYDFHIPFEPSCYNSPFGVGGQPLGTNQTFLDPRCQKQPQPDGVTIVFGNLERKVVRTKSEKKQKIAGSTGNVNTNCVEYDFHIPSEPSCHDSQFGLGGQPWVADPYMYCMPNLPSFSYPLVPYNVNNINIALHGPGMQGYPASYYSSEFQPRVFQDPESSAHARQPKRSKGEGPQSHKPERHRSHTSKHKGRSKRRGRLVQQTTLDSSIEPGDYYEEFHVRKMVGAHPTTCPKNSGQRRCAQDSGWKEVAAHPTTSSPMDGGQHRRAQNTCISELHDSSEEPHGRKKARARSRSQRSSSRHSYRRHAYEGSTSSDDADEDSNFKRRW